MSIIFEKSPHIIGSGDGLVVDISNGELGNGVTSYYYFPLLLSGYNAFSASHDVLTAMTVTYEATHDLPEVDDASAAWRDITMTISGGVASSYTSAGSITDSLPLGWPRMRIKYVTTNATNALQIRMSRFVLR